MLLFLASLYPNPSSPSIEITTNVILAVSEPPYVSLL